MIYYLLRKCEFSDFQVHRQATSFRMEVDQKLVVELAQAPAVHQNKLQRFQVLRLPQLLPSTSDSAGKSVRMYQTLQNQVSIMTR